MIVLEYRAMEIKSRHWKNKWEDNDSTSVKCITRWRLRAKKCGLSYLMITITNTAINRSTIAVRPQISHSSFDLKSLGFLLSVKDKESTNIFHVERGPFVATCLIEQTPLERKHAYLAHQLVNGAQPIHR